MKYDFITILGPTAVGKTGLAARLAYHFKGEIISADSRQVYKRMNIGTGKDYDDYIVNGIKVPYHLIDILEPNDEFDLFDFCKRFYTSHHEIIKRMSMPFLVGGTGLYIQAILKNYNLVEVDLTGDRFEELNKLDLAELAEKLNGINSNLHNTTDLKIKERIIKAIIIAQESEKSGRAEEKPLNSFVIGITQPREIIKKKITARLKQRLESGMIEEVENLLKEGVTQNKLNFFGLEYKFIGRHILGELNYNDMYQKLNSAIHQFAKRQMTWFRKMEREGIKINWIDGLNFERAKSMIETNCF